MAFLNKIVIAATAFAALTAARPLALRDVTSVVTETAYTTIDVPVTVWVDEDGKPLSTVAQGGNFAASATPVADHSKVESSASPSTPHSVSAPVVPTTTSAPPPPAPVVPTTTAAPSVPTQAQAQAPAYTPPAYTPPAPSPSPVATTTTSAVAPPVYSAPSSSSAAPVAPTNTPSPGQTSGECSPGAPCSGDITHWDGGLGACGWNVDSNADMQIAMPVGMMGAQSNGNPYCGKSLTIKNPDNGQTVQATVGDKCMGCTGGSIDLTNVLFAAIGNGCDGRCSGFEWWFN
ncbi:hypothetical protein PMZ80_000605 [Knufia obscura]|uniref:Allergen Asp f 7 n=2 Tax=Knufia TaxID=430999 RepID=A0AAN8EIJ0_9EURO|nr:hypothetical protein PMZ80_000605 [Knufia obscura]KAK5956469.1 hypothetical protein OHC33_001954 [Knufia fluminis]